MSEFFIGSEHVGNFLPEKEIKDVKGYKLQRIDNSMYLSDGSGLVRLKPMDDESENLPLLFSSMPGTDNESIYRLFLEDGKVIVFLNTFHDVINLKNKQKSFIMYLRRSDERKMCSEGLGKIKAEDQKDVIKKLTRYFINNNSIFVLKDKNPGEYTLYGKDRIAQVAEERPGIYVINRIMFKQNKQERPFIQIYGDVRFVLSNDVVMENGNSEKEIMVERTTEIFDAWTQYMNFQTLKYQKELEKSKVCLFDYINVDLESVHVHPLNPIHDLEKMKGLDWEFISYSQIDGKMDLSKTSNILKIKQESPYMPIFLGEIKNRVNDTGELIFDYPRREMTEELTKSGGVLYLSDFSEKVTKRRRDNIISVIESKMNRSAEIVLNLSNPDVYDTQTGGNKKAVTGLVLNKMFGNSDVPLQEEYRQALNIALNTPDLALIQGPPGTGKTTLIKGLVARLTESSKNVKILVSSEQHEALFNVVEKLSDSNSLPPFVTSHRISDRNEDSCDRFVKNIENYQNELRKACDTILTDVGKNNHYAQSVDRFNALISEIRANNYSKTIVMECYDEISSAILDLGLSGKLSQYMVDLRIMLGDSASSDIDSDPKYKSLVRKIHSQRTDPVSFEDDGEAQLEVLQNFLKRNGYDVYVMDESLYQKLLSGDKSAVNNSMNDYRAYVEKLVDNLIIKNEGEFDDSKTLTKVIERIAAVVDTQVQNREPDEYSILDNFENMMNDLGTVSKLVRKYTTVFGSTCAQCKQSLAFSEVMDDVYDYVIIDEAARANPIDLMMPIMVGTKVILVGDHMQLPHYIETDVVREFEESPDFYKNINKGILEKSLFQLIYENLDRAYREGRLKFRRTAMINEQHRMHPIIGDFISESFYDCKIRNGAGTEDNINDYGVYEGKNIVCIDVPITRGPEVGHPSPVRQCEADAVIEVLKKIVNAYCDDKAPAKRQLNVGVISFYKRQVELINEMLENTFSDEMRECISCNTVDSYQGKEFDVVILSSVRSNVSAGNRIGFLKNADSRINVALSRAKRLLIFVGDTETMRDNEHLSDFFDYVEKHGYCETLGC